MLFSKTVIASALLGAVFAESSDIPTSSGIKSTIYRTTSILRTTKVSATTTLTSTLPIATSSSLSSSNVSNTTSSSLSSSTNVSNTTVSVGAMDYAEAALPTYANTFPISVITISTCVPTVIYSVVTVTPTESPVSATPSVGSAISYSLNATLPVATSTPTTPIFTGSAASLQGSVVMAVVAGFAAVLFV